MYLLVQVPISINTWKYWGTDGKASRSANGMYGIEWIEEMWFMKRRAADAWDLRYYEGTEVSHWKTFRGLAVEQA